MSDQLNPPQIVGVGTLGMDVFMQVDTLPGEDGFAVVTGRDYLPGGSGTNVIAQASRLGARCAYIAQVGDDTLGDQIIASLGDEGVDASGMVRKPGGVSLSTTVVVDAQGARFILLDMGDAFGSLTPEQVNLDLVRSAKVLYTDLLPGAPAFAAVRAAHEAGVPVVANLQVSMDTMAGLGVTADDLWEILPFIDHFLPCRDGLLGLAETDDVDAALARVRKATQATLILTRGAEGVRAVTPAGEVIDVPAVPVTAIDTTGAGDSFAGAYCVYGVLEGRPLAEALAIANRCAAITCTGLGARSGPDRAHLEQALNA